MSVFMAMKSRWTDGDAEAHTHTMSKLVAVSYQRPWGCNNICIFHFLKVLKNSNHRVSHNEGRAKPYERPDTAMSDMKGGVPRTPPPSYDNNTYEKV